jgi:hypothetical protein
VDTNLIVVALQRKVVQASTLLQQTTNQTAEQKQLVDKKLANLACRADKAMLLCLPNVSGCWYFADGDDEILLLKWSLDALANKLHVAVKGGGILSNMCLGRQPASRVYALEANEHAMDDEGHLQGYSAICQRATLGAHAALPTVRGQRPTRSGWLAVATNVHHSMGHVWPVDVLGIRRYCVTIW